MQQPLPGERNQNRLWQQYRQCRNGERQAVFRIAECISLSQRAGRGMHLQREGPDRSRARSARDISVYRWWLGNNSRLGRAWSRPSLLAMFEGYPDADRRADYISGRYSCSLSDQPVADRRPRQTNSARHCRHSRCDFIAEIYRGILTLLAALPTKSPGDSGALTYSIA